ncbi:hypothetical protein [Actinokineospora terrae]|uniref:hypothetical protein n=1 Tax=Actinokineospora terrae TaxID=155974 RepID=UPI0015A71F67|nr:hypothetical protein [Actinokineospora terrae]
MSRPVLDHSRAVASCRAPSARPKVKPRPEPIRRTLADTELASADLSGLDPFGQ